MRILKISFSLLFSFTTIIAAFAQKQTIAMAEAIAKNRTDFAPAVLRQIQWIPNSQSFSYVVGSKVIRVSSTDLKSDTLDLLTGINAGRKTLGLPEIPAFAAFTWVDGKKLWYDDGGNLIGHSLEGSSTIVNRYPRKVEALDIHDTTLNAAYRRADTLLVTVKTKELVVAAPERPGVVYGKSVHRDEFGIYKGTFWSPSGRYLAFYRMDESMVTEYPIYVLDSMPAQGRKIRYPFAGSKSHHVTIGVFDTQNPGRMTYLETGLPAEQYLTNIAWTPDNRFILVAVVNREQNHMWLRQYDAVTGGFVKTLFEESSDRWVEPENPAVFLPGSNTDFIWQSERDGYNQLYWYDLTGKLKRQLTSGPNPVTRFSGFSKDGKRCFYQAADESGLNRFIYSLDIKGDKAVNLAAEPGVHQIIPSSDGEWALDIFSSETTPRAVSVIPIKSPGKRRAVFTAANPVSNIALGATQVLQLQSPGGVALNGRLILPVNFDSTARYPCIVYVYGGPHAQMITNTWMAGAEMWMHRMAQLGFAVFTLDNRGSANRGFSFESAIHRQIGDAEIEDQLVGVRYLKQLPFIDTTRLGVFGWSYGGFMATSLMTRPEAAGAFKVGIAGGPVIDWRMYEIMYTERYMDMPQENPEGYAKNSLFGYIDNLKGDLMIIHGSSDDVVLWQHSLRYVREAVSKGKPIDYFVYPEHFHNVLGRDRIHLFEKIERYFRERLRVF